MMNDTALRQQVLEELQFEPSLDATHVGVAVHGGVVTLTGHVPSYAQKRVAEQVVGRVKGVKAVAQDLEVHLASDKKRADDEIAERAVRILEWNDSVPSNRIKVTVERGWVSLSGEVDWQFQKDAVEAAVHKLSGVVGVTNSVEVTPRATPVGVREKLVRAFERQAALDARAVNIAVEGNRVTLTGQVSSW